jgi:hypothetical protein
MLYVIRRNWTEWVEAFPTLAEAQARFDELAVSNPDWNLQILPDENSYYKNSDVSWAETQVKTSVIYNELNGALGNRKEK